MEINMAKYVNSESEQVEEYRRAIISAYLRGECAVKIHVGNLENEDVYDGQCQEEVIEAFVMACSHLAGQIAFLTYQPNKHYTAWFAGRTGREDRVDGLGRSF